MPKFYAELLLKIAARADNRRKVGWGQGLNFPLTKLNEHDAEVPVIVRDTRFVAVVADGRIRQSIAREPDRIPALIMPRGIGRRYYCTFNQCKAFSYSHVELYLPNDLWNSELHYCLWAYLNSSFVWLFREITGRKNLGGGMLKAEATDMKTLPVDLNCDFADDAKQVFDRIGEREPMSVAEEVYTEEHLLIDEMVADYFGFMDMQERIRDTLIEKVEFRANRA